MDINSKKFALITLACIALYVLAGLLITPVEDMTNAKISLCLFSVIVSFATSMLVFVNEQRAKRKCIFGKDRDVIVKTSKKHALIFSIILFIASLIFFYVGFKHRMWYIAWIVFLIAKCVIEILRRCIFKKY